MAKRSGRLAYVQGKGRNKFGIVSIKGSDDTFRAKFSDIPKDVFKEYEKKRKVTDEPVNLPVQFEFISNPADGPHKSYSQRARMVKVLDLK